MKNIILPIPAAGKKLHFFDLFVLWSDLGIGLLVLLAGAFLIPALSFPIAFLAIILGTVIGSALLAIVGLAGTKNGLPTMVLLRSPMGIRGSYLPTILNIFQMIGWAIFEVIIMSFAANAISTSLWSWNNYHLWVIIISLSVIILGRSGPITVIKKWLKKFAFWIMCVTSIWLTYRVLSVHGISGFILLPGKGGLPFLQAVDLVIAMPISWIPMVADYNRFGRKLKDSFWGTFAGFSLTNIWFFALGALLSFGAPIVQTPKEFVSAILLSASIPAFLILLVDELDNAWADIYSAAVSLQNLFPALEEKKLSILIGFITLVVALFLDITQYSNFLLLLSSIFVPLFGVFIADYFFTSKKFDYRNLYKKGGPLWKFQGVNITGVISWICGVFIYQFITFNFPSIGASIPSLVVSFVLYLALLYSFKGKNEIGFKPLFHN